MGNEKKELQETEEIVSTEKDEFAEDYADKTNEENGYTSDIAEEDDINDFAIAAASKGPQIPPSGMAEDSFDEIDIADFEDKLNNTKSDEIDDYSEKINYDNFIVLNKRDVMAFCAAVEPMTKTSVDDYGKCVFIRQIDENVIELNYLNHPNRLTMKMPNKSGKRIRNFSILVTILKKLVTNAYASIVFVEENDEINIALCDSLIYLETKPLKEELYDFEKVPCTEHMDKEIATYTFRKVGNMLNASDRASEKVIVIKNNTANFNTGFFAAKSKSPFVKSEDFVIFKMVAEVITLLATVSKVDLRYSILEDRIALTCDGAIYCELPIATGDKVDEFYSPVTENSLKFDASIVIVGDTLLRLIQITKTLDYLSDIVGLTLTKEEMKLSLSSTNQTKTSEYSFNILEGEPERIGEMKLSCQVLINFFGITGPNIKYAFTEEGLGIKNEHGSFLLRRN